MINEVHWWQKIISTPDWMDQSQLEERYSVRVMPDASANTQFDTIDAALEGGKNSSTVLSYQEPLLHIAS